MYISVKLSNVHWICVYMLIKMLLWIVKFSSNIVILESLWKILQFDFKFAELTKFTSVTASKACMNTESYEDVVQCFHTRRIFLVQWFIQLGGVRSFVRSCMRVTNTNFNKTMKKIDKRQLAWQFKTTNITNDHSNVMWIRFLNIQAVYSEYHCRLCWLMLTGDDVDTVVNSP